MNKLYIFINIVGLIFEILIINNFFRIVSKNNSKFETRNILISAGLIIVQIIVIIFVKKQFWVSLALIVSMFILAFSYEMNLYARFLAVVGLTGLFMIGEVFVGLILSKIYNVSVEAASENISFYMQGVILSKLFMIIVIKIYSYFRTPAKNRPSGKLFLVMLVQPVATCMCIYIISTYMYDEKDDLKILFAIIVSILLVSANIVMFYLMEYQMNENEKRNISQLHNQQMQYKVDYYKELAERQRTSNKTMHDLKNQLFALKNAFNDNSRAGIDKLNELCESILAKNALIYTGKDAIDALISAKYQKMVELNINFKHSIFMIENDSVDMFDLCIVLGNLLDNAIEANEKIATDKREIYLEMRQNGEYLYIKMTNPMHEELTVRQGSIMTTKKDVLLHGFGLKSIEEITKKYKGSITHKQEKETFMAVVLLINDIKYVEVAD